MTPIRGNGSFRSILLIARKYAGQSQANSFINQQSFNTYVLKASSAMKDVGFQINSFASSHDDLTFWGTGLEFLNLWAHYARHLRAGRTIHFVDSNSGKQGKLIDGIAVKAPQASPVKGGLVCCSYMSAPSILRDAEASGWSESNIFVLQ